MSKKKASKLYGIPRTTIIFRLSGKFIKTNHGPSTVLTPDEETKLCDWIKHCSRKGFPRRKVDIIESVKQFLTSMPRKNPFKDNTPGEGWFKAFCRRHPELVSRTAEHVTSASSCVSETDIKKWFDNIYNYLNEEGYADILEDSTRIFNGDETNFQLCPKGHKVIGVKGARNIDVKEEDKLYKIWRYFRHSSENIEEVSDNNTSLENTECVNDTVTSNDNNMEEDNILKTPQTINVGEFIMWPNSPDRNVVEKNIPTENIPVSATSSIDNVEETIISNPPIADISEILVWPKSPERKGKRSCERVPWVITSSTFQDILDKKILKKTEQENAKALKQKEREQKRAEAQIKKQERVNNKKNKINVISNILIKSADNNLETN